MLSRQGHRDKDKEVLEAVQKRAARSVFGVKAQAYEGRLKESGWVSLTERRQRADMAMMNGFISERMDIVKSDWFVPAASGEISTRREHWQTECETAF